jgi:RES domain
MTAPSPSSGEIAHTQPPATPQVPAIERLPSGTTLNRVHRLPHKVSEFNPTPASPYSGGRFDSPDGKYAHLYAGQSEAAAVAETLLRSLPSNGKGRFLPRVTLKERVLSALQTTLDLDIVRLHGDGLLRIGAVPGLTKCEARDYPYTRNWAQSIRTWAPTASGFVWRSRHHDDLLSYVFFSDRTPGAAFLDGPGNRIDGGPGLVLLRKMLLPYRIAIPR